MTKPLTKFTRTIAAALVGSIIALNPVIAVAQDGVAQAQDAKPDVDLKSDVKAYETTTDADGNQTVNLVEPTVFTPGTRLSFGLSYENNGQVAATDVTATNPLHEAVRLSADADPALNVSVDGGKTFGMLANLTVEDESGVAKPASHADVTHVRWTIASIAPGERGRVAFPVIIR